MSESEAVAGRRDEEDECPLCLDPLPPFWDRERRVVLACCGKQLCRDCNDKRTSLVERAIAEGSYGKEEEQLLNFCPLCRTKAPPGNDTRGVVKMMTDKFEKGRLPLNRHLDLGMWYQKGMAGAEINVEKGLEILMLGAEKGDPCCQTSIGNRYRDGTGGLPKSPAEAKQWFLAAAKQGHAMAEYQLALLLKDESNDAEYLRYLKDSASKGYNYACCELGYMYYYGRHGLQRSTEQAIRVWTPAVERGHAASMGLLGNVMCCPHDGPLPPSNRNFTKGMHWLRRAAKAGDQQSVSKLGALEKWASSKCFRCYKPAPSGKAFLRCSRCCAAWYCSKDCQVQHWKAKGGHKQVCIKWEYGEYVS